MQCRLTPIAERIVGSTFDAFGATDRRAAEPLTARGRAGSPRPRRTIARRLAAGAVLTGFLAVPALAQSQFPTPAPDSVVRGEALLIPNGATSGGQPVYAPPSATNPLPVTASPISGAGSVTAATVGTSSAEVLAAAARRLLAIDNESNTATIACALGSTAALNSAGSFTIPPGMTRTWDGDFVPSEALNCVADAASTPVTVEAE